MSKHIKHSFKKFSLQAIIRRKTNSQKKIRDVLDEDSFIEKTIKKYHENNENIK